MSEQEPTKPYIYQPFGVTQQNGTGRLWGIGGIHRPFDPAVEVTVKGLTREEAESICGMLQMIQDPPPALLQALAQEDQT